MGSFSGDKSGHFSAVSLFRAAAEVESREVLGLAPVCCLRSALAARQLDITRVAASDAFIQAAVEF